MIQRVELDPSDDYSHRGTWNIVYNSNIVQGHSSELYYILPAPIAIFDDQGNLGDTNNSNVTMVTKLTGESATNSDITDGVLANNNAGVGVDLNNSKKPTENTDGTSAIHRDEFGDGVDPTDSTNPSCAEGYGSVSLSVSFRERQWKLTLSPSPKLVEIVKGEDGESCDIKVESICRQTVLGNPLSTDQADNGESSDQINQHSSKPSDTKGWLGTFSSLPKSNQEGKQESDMANCVGALLELRLADDPIENGSDGNGNDQQSTEDSAKPGIKRFTLPFSGFLIKDEKKHGQNIEPQVNRTSVSDTESEINLDILKVEWKGLCDELDPVDWPAPIMVEGNLYHPKNKDNLLSVLLNVILLRPLNESNVFVDKTPRFVTSSVAIDTCFYIDSQVMLVSVDSGERMVDWTPPVLLEGYMLKPELGAGFLGSLRNFVSSVMDEDPSGEDEMDGEGAPSSSRNVSTVKLDVCAVKGYGEWTWALHDFVPREDVDEKDKTNMNEKVKKEEADISEQLLPGSDGSRRENASIASEVKFMSRPGKSPGIDHSANSPFETPPRGTGGSWRLPGDNNDRKKLHVTSTPDGGVDFTPISSENRKGYLSTPGKNGSKEKKASQHKSHRHRILREVFGFDLEDSSSDELETSHSVMSDDDLDIDSYTIIPDAAVDVTSDLSDLNLDDLEVDAAMTPDYQEILLKMKLKRNIDLMRSLKQDNELSRATCNKTVNTSINVSETTARESLNEPDMVNDLKGNVDAGGNRKGHQQTANGHCPDLQVLKPDDDVPLTIAPSITLHCTPASESSSSDVELDDNHGNVLMARVEPLNLNPQYLQVLRNNNQLVCSSDDELPTIPEVSDEEGPDESKGNLKVVSSSAKHLEGTNTGKVRPQEMVSPSVDKGAGVEKQLVNRRKIQSDKNVEVGPQEMTTPPVIKKPAMVHQSVKSHKMRSSYKISLSSRYLDTQEDSSDDDNEERDGLHHHRRKRMAGAGRRPKLTDGTYASSSSVKVYGYMGHQRAEDGRVILEAKFPQRGEAEGAETDPEDSM